MWPRSRAPKKSKDENLSAIQKTISVNEEYRKALRTQSYAEFFTKAQLMTSNPSASPQSSKNSTEMLLEPEQDTVPSIIEELILPEPLSDLKHLMISYFDTSAEASRMCAYLLRSINESHSNYRFIQRALERFTNHSADEQRSAISELDSFTLLRNPFSDPNQLNDFKQIHDRYSSILDRLRLKRKKVVRRIKLIEYIKKVTGICLTVACGVVAMVAIGIAVHSLTGLVMGPLLLGISPCRLKKLSNLSYYKGRFLRKVGKQLDAAEKGTYILNRVFDTMSRLVARLCDEVEHNKLMIRFWLEKEDKFSLQEVVKELKKSGRGFMRQVEELEEHVCLCLVAINRARVLVIKEMSAS